MDAGAENTSQGIAPVGRISTSREEIAELLGVPRYGETGTTAFGNLGEEDPAGLNPHIGAVSQGDVKTSLETESAKQVYLMFRSLCSTSLCGGYSIARYSGFFKAFRSVGGEIVCMSSAFTELMCPVWCSCTGP